MCMFINRVFYAPGDASYVINVSGLHWYVMKYRKLLFKAFFVLFIELQNCSK